MGERVEKWSIRFSIADEVSAQALALELSQFGFTRVDGYPNGKGSWAVSARSYGPFRGVEAQGVLERAAVTIARPFGGIPEMIGSGANPPHARPKPLPIMLDRPGVQPPVPALIPVVTPPKAHLSMTPDLVERRQPDLSGLDVIDWASIAAVGETGARIPDRLRRLAAIDASGDSDGWSDALEAVTELLTNSGDLWDAAAVTVPFLAELARCTGVAAHRRDLTAWLFALAGGVATELILDADRAAIQRRAPAASAEVLRTYEAVGAEVGSLLATWAAQPPAVQLQLARLAGLFPEHGRGLRGEIAAFADGITGTRQHVILHLVLALLDERYEDAVVLAAPTGRWRMGHLDNAWLDAPGITNRASAEHALDRSTLHD